MLISTMARRLDSKMWNDYLLLLKRASILAVFWAALTPPNWFVSALSPNSHAITSENTYKIERKYLARRIFKESECIDTDCERIAIRPQKEETEKEFIQGFSLTVSGSWNEESVPGFSLPFLVFSFSHFSVTGMWCFYQQEKKINNR